MPEPILVKPPVPVIAPAYAAGLVLSPPTVRVAAAEGHGATGCSAAAQRTDLGVEAGDIQRGSRDVRYRHRRELLPNAPLTFATEATPAVNVPALTTVAPVYVFAPERVAVSPLSLVRLKVPVLLMTLLEGYRTGL